MTSRRSGTAAGTLAVAVVAMTALTGCGGAGSGDSGGPGSGGPGGSGTSATPTKATPTKATTKPASAEAVSTVKGRKHDAGVITSTKKAGGLTVLVLNRYTVKGLSDAKLAADGAPVSPHSDVRFTDQNKGKTYLVPVNPSAPFVVNTCDDSSGTPSMISTPVSLADFLARPNRAKTVVILTYDDSGRLVRLDTDPVC